MPLKIAPTTIGPQLVGDKKSASDRNAALNGHLCLNI